MTVFIQRWLDRQARQWPKRPESYWQIFLCVSGLSDARDETGHCTRCGRPVYGVNH